jgi:ABC-type glycerol-3-phosphate transport system substrate-binding protein
MAEVSEGEMRKLAKKMLKEAGVSPEDKKEYWELFEEYLKELKEKKANP